MSVKQIEAARNVTSFKIFFFSDLEKLIGSLLLLNNLSQSMIRTFWSQDTCILLKMTGEWRALVDGSYIY